MELVYLNKENHSEIEETIIKSGRTYSDVLRKSVEEGMGIGIREYGILVNTMIILPIQLTTGHNIGKIMYSFPKDMATIIEEEVIKFIKEKATKFDGVIIYNAAIDKKEYYKKNGIQHIETLIHYSLDMEGFKPYELDIPLEKAKIEDVDFIYEVDTKAFDPIWHENKKQTEALLNPGENKRFMVLREEGKIVGISYSRYNEDDKMGHLGRLAVNPSYQGKGYGKVLLRDSLNWFYYKGANMVDLNTQSKNNQSRPLYESHKFKVVEEKYVYMINGEGLNVE